MREIKFRAWDKRFKRMIYAGAMAILYLNDNDHEIMQFTGLHDKNGKEIYEGDILERYTCFVQKGKDPHKKSIVCWDVWHWEGINGWKESEVIGNIYESPTLLKGDV